MAGDTEGLETRAALATGADALAAALALGETLIYVGKEGEAQKHFTRAAHLDLTPFEKSKLRHP